MVRVLVLFEVFKFKYDYRVLIVMYFIELRVLRLRIIQILR